MYLGIEPEIDDWVGTDGSFGQDTLVIKIPIVTRSILFVIKIYRYGEDIVGELSVGFVASYLRYRGAGIGEPAQHEGTQLNISPVHDCLDHTLGYHDSNHDCQSPVPV